MKKLCLESNENSSELTVTGDIDAIFGNRRAARYLKDTLKFNRTEDTLVIVTDDINKCIDRIKKFVNTYLLNCVFQITYLML